MSLAVIMLVHTELGRAAQAARAWAEGGCPVVMHVDRCVPPAAFGELRAALSDLPRVRLVEARRRCEWGTWQIVAATQDAAELALNAFPGANHVLLASGSCLPLRAPAELAAFLSAHPASDFIESVTVEEVVWAKGGLEEERFSLFFPFGWKSRRKLFDFGVNLQRALRIRRRAPGGLSPHLGSQWWCLTRATLSAILNDPERPAFERYFSKVWIPDESYFQTLARRHARRIESRSLTFSRFDAHGQPHVFYDDHRALLEASGAFVARKIWPQADALYAAFPRPATRRGAVSIGRTPDKGAGAEGGLVRRLEAAQERRQYGRPGLCSQGRLPRDWVEARPTAEPYWVFQGFDALLDDFAPWLSGLSGAVVHGHLFAPDRAQFADGAEVGPGGLSAAPALRDQDPKAFLRNLLWASRGQRPCFLHGPADLPAALPQIAGDPNARVALISGAWAVALFRGQADFALQRREAARLQRLEAAQIAALRGPGTRAQVKIWTLSDFLKEPMDHLHALLDEIVPIKPARITPAPIVPDLTEFGAFLEALRDCGMQPQLMGEFPVGVRRPAVAAAAAALRALPASDPGAEPGEERAVRPS